MKTPFAFNAFALKHPNHPRGQGDRLPPTVTDVSRLGGAGVSSTQRGSRPRVAPLGGRPGLGTGPVALGLSGSLYPC